MGNCVRSNVRSSPTVIRKQYQYQPTEQVDTTAVATATPPSARQPDEPNQQQQYEEDQPLSWQQQEALVQHIADREGVYILCMSTCSSVHKMYAEVLCSVGYRIQCGHSL